MSTRIESVSAPWLSQAGALIEGIQREEYGFDISLQDQPDLLDIPGFYQHGRGGFWVAIDGDRVVGTIGLRDLGSGAVALRKMFVARSHRGRQSGVAAALLEAAFAWIQTGAAADVYLGTTERFVAAHRFYEKHGFQRIDQQALPTTFPFMAADTRFYRLSSGCADA